MGSSSEDPSVVSVRPGFAIVRIDDYREGDDSRFTVTRVLDDQALAQTEVERLNRVNAGKGCRYVWQYTRVADDGVSS